MVGYQPGVSIPEKRKVIVPVKLWSRGAADVSLSPESISRGWLWRNGKMKYQVTVWVSPECQMVAAFGMRISGDHTILFSFATLETGEADASWESRAKRAVK